MLVAGFLDKWSRNKLSVVVGEGSFGSLVVYIGIFVGGLVGICLRGFRGFGVGLE